MPRAKDDDDLPGGEESAAPKKPAKAPPKAAPKAEEIEGEAASAGVPAKPAHSARLVALAQSYNISQADIHSLTSEELMAEISYEQRRIQAEQTQRKSAEPPPAAPAKPAAAAEVDPLDEIEEMLRAGEITEKVARVMRAPLKENKALKEKVSKIDEIEKREKDRSDKSLDDAVNAAFSELGERYSRFYGTGDLSDLKQGTDEYNRRVMTFRNAGIEATDSERIIKKKIAAVAKMTYGEGIAPAAKEEPAPASGYAAASPAPAKPAKKTKDELWAEAELARPSNRSGSPEPKGVHAAKQAVAKSMRDRGLEPGYIGNGAEDDDLPGGPD
jgi:hypothetical protein